MSDFYNTQPVYTAFNNVLLTAASSGNMFVFDTGGFQKLSLDINYARGSAEVASKLKFILESSSDDGVTWHSLVIDTTTTVSDLASRVWELNGTNKVNVLLDIAYKKMRLSVYESGVATNYGRVTVNTLLSGQ